MPDQTIRVRVTQEDIDAGERSDCARCPVARAVCRAVPGAVSAWVSYSDIEVLMLPDVLILASTPDRVALAVTEFDSSGVMEPFEFDLSLPTGPEVAARVEGEGNE